MLTLFKLTEAASVIRIAAMCIVFSCSISAMSASERISLPVSKSALRPVSADFASGRHGNGQATEYTLPQVVRLIESVHFGDRQLHGQSMDEFVDSLPVNRRFQKPGGVFVTLSSHGKTRACWGNVFPQDGSILRATEYATIGALTKEYRYSPVKRDEWQSLKLQVTIIRAVEPIESIRLQNPLRDGLLVRAGGKAGVLLPGEAADAHYQLIQCKLKAGIRPGEPCQLYRLRTEIYE